MTTTTTYRPSSPVQHPPRYQLHTTTTTNRPSSPVRNPPRYQLHNKTTTIIKPPPHIDHPLPIRDWLWYQPRHMTSTTTIYIPSSPVWHPPRCQVNTTTTTHIPFSPVRHPPWYQMHNK